MTKKDQESHDEVTSTEHPEAAAKAPAPNLFEDQLAAKDKEIEQLKNEALREKAEQENVRRRAERAVSDAHKFGSEKLLRDLLPVLDSLVRGLESTHAQEASMKMLREGMELTLEILEKALLKHGVEEIAPQKGEAFNPEQHEAMSTLSDPSAEPNTVFEVIQKGYQLNGRVLRAAMVVVAK